MPRDIPIIFSAPMVRSLLDGRKTMTRRLAWQFVHRKRVIDLVAGNPCLQDDHGRTTAPSPWQKVEPGDRLWVRENFARNANQLSDAFMDTSLVYAADGKGRALDNGGEKPWTPCIHMPRWASRLTLVVTATKIERLQNMSHKDAIAEGVVEFRSGETMFGVPVDGGFKYPGMKPQESFTSLWSSLHGAASWSDNPEVVALTFRVIKANIDAPEARVA